MQIVNRFSILFRGLTKLLLQASKFRLNIAICHRDNDNGISLASLFLLWLLMMRSRRRSLTFACWLTHFAEAMASSTIVSQLISQAPNTATGPRGNKISRVRGYKGTLCKPLPAQGSQYSHGAPWE
jgi:hypothetical protein